MRRMIHFLFLVSLVIGSCVQAFYAQAVGGSEREIDEIRQDVSRLYGITSKKIAVRMKSGTTLKGYINKVESETFTLADSKTGAKTDIKYADVSNVSKTGLSKAQKAAMTAGVVGGLIIVGVVFRPKGKGGLRCLLCN